MVKLSDEQWMKLRDFSKVITASLRKKLPGDWYLPDEDIQGAVYGVFIKILQSYRPGAMSPTSYCWQYGERSALQALLREYRRIKSQVPFEDVENPPEDEYGELREYGEYEIEPYKDMSEHIEQQDYADRVQKIADAHGLGKIARLLKTMTEREIAEELCQSQPAVHRKIEKLRKLCEGLA